MIQYCSKVRWQSDVSLNSWLNSRFLIPVWIENCESRTSYWELSWGSSLTKAVPVCWVSQERNIKNRDATIEESSLDSREDRESSVALLLKGTVIIFDFYNVNQTFALTTFKHFDLLRYKFILNEGRSCHWEWYPENKPVESPFHYTVTGAVLCIFFCTNML